MSNRFKWACKKDYHSSTSGLIYHLNAQHPEQMKELDAMEKKSKADNVVKAEQGLKRFMTKPGETSRERKEPRLLESRASTPPITTAIRNGRRAEKKSNGLRGPLCR